MFGKAHTVQKCFCKDFTMECVILFCFLFPIFFTINAEPVVSSPEENRSQYPDPAALFNSDKPVSQGALLLLKDYVKRGDTLLKERLKESYSNLKEQLTEGNTRLKERIVGSVVHVEEELKEGDHKLKEELDEDVAWLKDKLTKGLSRVKEELAEEETKTKEKLTEQSEAFEKLRNSVKQWTQSSSAPIDDLKQQMSEVQTELKSTKHQLQTTQTDLRTNQDTLRSTQDTLQSTQDTLQSTLADLQITQEKVKNTEQELQRTREQLQNEVQAFTALKTQLQTAEDEIHSLKAGVDSLQSSHRLDVSESSKIGEEHVCSESGSTFIRWGRASCPENTSLVYSGVAGGSWYDHTGGASNYLCLVSHPQLDNMTLPAAVNYLYGTEYQHINEYHDEDVVCSVCRASQATTLMVPATLTCPPGWTTQYKGHLMSGYFNSKGRTEYVCVDEIRENNDSGHEDNNGALLYQVVTACGSLPCPPYVTNKVVTGVVCSM